MSHLSTSYRVLQAALAVIFVVLITPSGGMALGASTDYLDNIDITPRTWDRIGEGVYPLGVRICNRSGVTLYGVQTKLYWRSQNPHIALDSPLANRLGLLGGGRCTYSYYSVGADSVSAGSGRRYQIQITGEGGQTLAWDKPRVLRAVRFQEERGRVIRVAGIGGCEPDTKRCDPLPRDLRVGRRYLIKVYSHTSFSVNQLGVVLGLPGKVFRIERAWSRYQSPSGLKTDSPDSSACPRREDFVCLPGPVGGRIRTTYQVLVVGPGRGYLKPMLYAQGERGWTLNRGYSNPQNWHYYQATKETEKRKPHKMSFLDRIWRVLSQGDVSWKGECRSRYFCMSSKQQHRGYSLSLQIRGKGSAWSDTGGLNCGTGQSGICQARFSGGRTVSLQPLQVHGWIFQGWSGDCFGKRVCEIRLNSSKQVRAIFTRSPTRLFRMGFYASQGGNIRVEGDGLKILCRKGCSADYLFGTGLTLSASPDPGYKLARWSGCNQSRSRVDFDGACYTEVESTHKIKAWFCKAGAAQRSSGSTSLSSTKHTYSVSACKEN